MNAAQAIKIMGDQALIRQDELLHTELKRVARCLEQGDRDQVLLLLHEFIVVRAQQKERAEEQGKPGWAHWFGMLIYTYNIARALIMEESRA